MAMSHTSSYGHAASSSAHMRVCCGPRKRSGFSAVKPRIVETSPVQLYISMIMSDLLYILISSGGMTLSRPLSPSKHVNFTS